MVLLVTVCGLASNLKVAYVIRKPLQELLWKW